MYKVTLELKTGILDLYIENIQELGKIILEHTDDYTGCRVKRVDNHENIEKQNVSRTIRLQK